MIAIEWESTALNYKSERFHQLTIRSGITIMLQNRLAVLRQMGYHTCAVQIEQQIYALGEDVGRKDARFETLIAAPRVTIERYETPRGILEVVVVSGIVDTGVRSRGRIVAKYHMIAGMLEQKDSILREVFKAR